MMSPEITELEVDHNYFFFIMNLADNEMVT